MAGLLVSGVVGCKKAEQPSTAPVQQNGVGIDSRKLQAALATVTSDDVRAAMQKFSFSLRYRNYVDAMVALDKLAADPGLNEAQKKLVAEVMEQVKQANNAKDAAAAAAPAAK